MINDFSIYKSEYSGMERMKKYLSGDLVDHQPFALHVGLVANEIYGYTTSEVSKDFDKLLEVLDRSEEDYGASGLCIALSNRTLGQVLGSRVHIPKHGIPTIERYVLEDYNELENLVIPDPRTDKILSSMLELGKRYRESRPNKSITTNVTGPFSTAAGFRPVEKILRDTRKNKEALKSLLEFSTQATLEWVRAFTEIFGQAQLNINDPVASTTVLGRSQYEEFSHFYLDKLVNGIVNITGFKPSLHICGETKPIWDFIKELNIASFSPDNIEDIGETKDFFGEKMLVVGNISPVDVLRLGSQEDVIEAVVTCLKKASTSPNGYVIASGCQIPLGTPKENLDAFMYAVRKYGAGAKLGELPKGLNELSK